MHGSLGEAITRQLNMPAENSTVSLPWLDKKVLELWLQTHYRDVTVTDIEIKDGTVKGDNYLSLIHRLLARTKNGDSHPILVKCRMEEGVTAKLMKDSNIFRKEQEMYGNTLPRLNALLKKALPDSFEPLAPKCFYSSKCFLVLEDLAPAGFKMGDRLQGLDLKHCLAVMKSLARLHAASIIMIQEDPDCVKEYEVNFFSQPCLNEAWRRCFVGMTENLIQEMETWPAEWEEYVQKLQILKENILERHHKVTRSNVRGLNVLAHGDLWVNNVLFNKDGSSVRFVDFQLVTHMSPAIDIHLFICTSASIDVRKHHTDTLLQEYHNTLCDTLTALGFTQPMITLEELHEEFDRKSFYGLWAVIVPAACMLAHPDCGFELDDALEKGETPGPSMFSENYKKSAKIMLPMLEARGAFIDK